MKPGKSFLFVTIVFLLIFGCSTPTAIGTPTPNPANTPAPAETPPPPGSRPAPTPSGGHHPALSPNGPHLAYQDQQGDQTVIKLLDADGNGQAVFAYPANAADSSNLLPLSQTVSPDGKWLAWYSGSAGTCFGQAGQDSADLALNLMSLSDGTVRLVTRLLSKDYPNIFTKAAQQLGRPDVSADMLRNAFICGISQSLDWSPDGHYLAFAGQMDGLSSDLYLFEPDSGSLKRLSSGPEEVQWISWSPDGKWILDGSSYTEGEGIQYNIYATSVDGSTIKQLSTGTPQIVTASDWLDDHSYFDTNGTNGPGSYDLKLVDVKTGKTSHIWKGSYSASTFVPYGHWVALVANTPDWPYSGNDFQTGVFLVDTASLQQLRVNSLGPWGCCTPPNFDALGHSDERLFLVNGNPSYQIEYLSSTGKLTSTGMQADKIPSRQTGWSGSPRAAIPRQVLSRSSRRMVLPPAR